MNKTQTARQTLLLINELQGKGQYLKTEDRVYYPQKDIIKAFETVLQKFHKELSEKNESALEELREKIIKLQAPE